MIEVTKFKLYPDRETEDKLFSNLRICSFVYNWCLEHSVWKDSVLPQLKEVYPDNGMEPEKTSGTKVVGIDLNVSNFSTDSDGLVVDHPKNVTKAETKLKRQQRKLSRKIRGSHNRKKQKRIVAQVHEKVENRRNDLLHKTSRYYIDNYDLIALEDLSIAGLVQSGNRGLSKAILDASWGKFANYISYKAENAGKYAVQVIAKGTTQDCSVCGKTVAKDLSVRTHSCPYCISVMPRDYNSARNIKLRGIKMVGWGTPEPGILNMGKLNTLAEIRTSILDVNNPQKVFVNEPRISRLQPWRVSIFSMNSF
jgi:IS605 OrfB family transposase